MTDWDQPDSHDKLRPWRLVDPLTLYQAVMLIFGRAPNGRIIGRPSGYDPMAFAMKQAIERRDLPARIDNNPLEGRPYSLDVEERVFVAQADVRNWLRQIGNTDAFFFAADPAEWPAEDAPPKRAKSLDARERTTMLRIIRALDVMASLPQRGPASSVELQLQKLGFATPKDAAIRKTLADARSLAPDSKPQ